LGGPAIAGFKQILISNLNQ